MLTGRFPLVRNVWRWLATELELEFEHSKPVVAVGNTEPLAGCSNLDHLQLAVGRSIAGSRRHSQRQSTGR